MYLYVYILLAVPGKRCFDIYKKQIGVRFVNDYDNGDGS